LEQTDKDDPSLLDIAAWRDMPSLPNDMNLHTRPIEKPHESFRAQKPIAERCASGLERDAIKALIGLKRKAA